MKRIFTFIPAMLMVFSLYACTVKQEEADAVPSTPAETETEDITSEESTPIETTPPDYGPADNVGFFDPGFDYASAPRYKVQFVGLGEMILQAKLNEAFSHWASRMNIEYGQPVYANHIELFFQKLESFAAQGVEGFLLDPLSSMYPRADELLSELGVPWMSCFGSPRFTKQESAPLLHPYVRFNNYAIGADLMEKLFEKKDALWPNVSYEETGLIMAELSMYPPLSEGQLGTYDAWMEKTGSADHFFTADNSMLTGVGVFDKDVTGDNMRYIIRNHPEIKYWLIAAHYKRIADFAVEVLDELGLADHGCVVSSSYGFELEPLQIQWDSGVENAWKAAEFIPEMIYTEPIIGALYAFMSGQATPETIWPQWVNINDSGGEGGTYATLMLPSYWIDQDNYKRVLKWTDVYAGLNFFPEYPADSITPESYNARAEVPDYYSIKMPD